MIHILNKYSFFQNVWVLTLCFSYLLISGCGGKNTDNKKIDSVVVTKQTAAEKRLQWKNKLGWSDPRCMSNETFEGYTGIGQYPFEKGVSLVVVTCSLGAYQGDSLLYLLKGEKAQLLEFQQFQSGDIGELDSYKDILLTGIVQTELNGKAPLIKVWRKYRDIGDCGQLLRYNLENGQARLIELRVKECEETIKLNPPEQWPVVKLPVHDKARTL